MSDDKCVKTHRMLVESYPRYALQGALTAAQLRNEIYVQRTPTYHLARSHYPYVFEELTFVIIGKLMSICNLEAYGNARTLDLNDQRPWNMFWQAIIQPDIYIDQTFKTFQELWKIESTFKDRIFRDQHKGSKRLHFLPSVVHSDGTLLLQNPMFTPRRMENQHLQFISGADDITTIEQSTGYVYNAAGRPLLHEIGHQNDKITVQNMESLDHVILSFTVVGVYEESFDTITAGMRLRPNQLVKIHGHEVPSLDGRRVPQIIKFPISIPLYSSSQGGQQEAQRAQEPQQPQPIQSARYPQGAQYLQGLQNLKELQGQQQQARLITPLYGNQRPPPPEFIQVSENTTPSSQST